MERRIRQLHCRPASERKSDSVRARFKRRDLRGRECDARSGHRLRRLDRKINWLAPAFRDQKWDQKSLLEAVMSEANYRFLTPLQFDIRSHKPVFGIPLRPSQR